MSSPPRPCGATARPGSFSIQDLYFFRPLEVNDGQAREVRVKLARSDEGYALEVRSDVLFEGRNGFQLNAQATLVPGRTARRRTDGHRQRVLARCTHHRDEDPDGLRSPQEDAPELRPALAGAAIGGLRRRRRHRPPATAAAFESDLQAGYLLHPALLDLATGWAMRLISGYDAATTCGCRCPTSR